MKKQLALAALASCLSFGASAQTFFDSFDNQTRLAQWTLSGTSSVIDFSPGLPPLIPNNADDYLFVPLPVFGGAEFNFTANRLLTGISISMAHASDGVGSIQLSHGSVNQSVLVGANGTTLDNPNSISFNHFFATAIPQGTNVRLRFQGGGALGMNIDNISITAVPEPGTYALMAAGLGIVGFMARRRRQASNDALAAQA